ncbi:Copia protein [Porphyridium purpureum]|uniref:Copia protein n=1 Tax=Porphyridium purpureum TaxID=35688 RepID=A0A5J4Z9B8_PORPP|nr:Copia protein [Porphyridium purpureum]|eukprot:POR4638..scf295_1
MESGQRTPTRLEQERTAALARQQQQAMQAELAAQAAAQQQQQQQQATTSAASDIENIRQALAQEFSRMREELLGQVQEERNALAAEMHRWRNGAYPRAEAASQVKAAPMAPFLGDRDALAVGAWCETASERIYIQLQEEYRAGSHPWDDDAEQKCVRIAASFFHGASRLWWSVLDPKPVRFDDFLQAFRREFEPIASDQVARDRLAACAQRNRSVHDYANDFGNCLLRLPSVGDSERLDRFVRGLQSKIQIQVLLRQPASYHEALRAALAVDAVFRQSVHASAFAEKDAAPMDLGSAEAPRRQTRAPNRKSKKRPKNQQRTVPRSAPQAPSRTARVGADTCHNCGRRGHWAAECTHELGVAEFEIGAAALAKSDLIQLPVFINGHASNAVVDTGATATFVSEAVCNKLRVPFTKSGSNGPRIRLADGRTKPITGKASFLLTVPGIVEERTEAWVHSGHHAMILGLDWLNEHQAKLQVGGKILLDVSTPRQYTRNAANARTPDTLECAATNEQNESSGGTVGIEHEVLHMPARADCDACQASKLQTMRAPRRTQTPQFSAFNDTVSVDLVDPTEYGICGARWLLTHRDATTGWLVVAPLANKTAESALTAFLEIQRGRGWPRLVRSDEGREFQGAFEVALKANLVAHESGLAHRPNTHATHERVHRDLNAGVRTLLLTAGLEPEWFAFAAKYWANARNAAWKSRDGIAPYQARYGRKWERDIPPFGRGVYIMTAERAKFHPRGMLSLVMGIRFPSPTTNRTPLNVLAIPLDNLRPSAAKWVGEWSLSTSVFPSKEQRSNEGAVDRIMPEWHAVLDPDGDRTPERARSEDHDEEKAQALQKQDIDVPTTTASREEYERRSWSTEMDDALRAGYAAHGPKWKTICDTGGEALSGVGGLALRSHASAIGLLGEKATGLGKHRRGRTAGDIRARQAVLNVAQQMQSESAAPGCDSLHLGVAEVVSFATHSRTQAGRLAFTKEMNTLISSGALPFQKALGRCEAARVPNARFVKLKPILAIKNSEMPPEHRMLKCRIVAQGCHITDVDGKRAPPETPQFDRPPGLSSIRAAVSVALHVHGAAADALFFDIDAAYVHAPLRGNPTFAYFKSLVPFLEGIVTRHVLRKIASLKDPVVPLPMALYGLPRAGFDYSAYARQKLCAAHWSESAADKNVYWRRRAGVLTLLVLYVDDGAILGTTASVNEAMHELVRMFRITKSAQLLSESSRARPIRYLGVNVYRQDEAWIFDSGEYARYIATAHKGGRARATPLSTRIETSEKLNACPPEARACLGKLMWLSRTTRPDLAYAVAMIARHTDRWSVDVQRAMDEVLAYLAKHANITLQYAMPSTDNKEINIVCFTDSDLDPGRSTSGVAIFLASGGTRHLVEWSSRRQRRVATSTAEAELVAMHSAVQNATFPIATFLDDVFAKWPRTTVRCDNETSLGAVSKGFSPVLVHANKTQRISLAWLHELHSEHLVAFEHVPTRANVADPFTKPVGADVFRGHARAWGLSSPLLSPSTGDSR